MTQVRLTDTQWNKMYPVLRADRRAYAGDECATRRYVEAVLWVCRSGAQWRLLPREYGNWNSVYKRYVRWCDTGVWARLFEQVAHDPDMETVMLDSTIVRAHPCAAGALKKNGDEQALGRSRGGFSTKIHIASDGLGYPLRLRLTEGQRHDSQEAEALLTGYTPDYVTADRSYAGQAFYDFVVALGAIPVIPPHQASKQPRDYDTWLYRERHLIECLVNKFKQFRRIFSRFEKRASRYLGFLHFAAALIWLR